LRRFSLETKKRFTEITKEALEKLQAYDWPGNVRELGNVMERAIVLGQGPKVHLEDLPPRVVASEPGTQPEPLSYHKAIDGYRRQLLITALTQTQGNRAAAARTLGLQRTYLSRLIKSLRID